MMKTRILASHLAPISLALVAPLALLLGGCGDVSSADAGTTDFSGVVRDLSATPDLAMPDLTRPADLVLQPDLTGGSPGAIVFADDYGAGVSFAPFGGSTNDLSIDMTEKHAGTASLKINVPMGGYTGGAMKAGAPVDLSGYTAITFWAKASKAVAIDKFGIGNDATDATYQAEWLPVNLTTTWTQYALPIPVPGKLTQATGLFHFAQGGNGPYTIWLDDVQYAAVPQNVLGTPAPAIATESVSKAVGETYDVMGASATWMIGGQPLTESVARAYFSFASSNPAAATVDGNGKVTAVAVGTTDITAKLGAIDAAGKLTFTVTGGFQGQVFTDDYGAGVSFAPFGGSTNDITVDLTEKHAGTASLKINVPNAGYTGGAMKAGGPADLTGFTAVTFWAKASKAVTIDKFGIGNDAADTTYQAEWAPVNLTANWTQYTLPIPDPAKLTKATGLFHFAQGGNGPYTIWLDDITYAKVPQNVLGDPAPAIATESVSKAIGDSYDVMGGSATWMIGGQPQTESIARPYFTYASSNPAAATVDANGHVTAVAVGATDITAKLGGVAAAGKLTVTVTAPVSPNAPPARPNLPAGNVISLFSNAYVNVPVDTWLTGWSSAMEMDVKVGADDVKKYTNLVFAGVETVAKTIDASAMTAFHVDLWTPDSTQFRIKLVDFGADGAFGGGDDTEHELAFDANSNPKLVTQAWVSFDLPLASFTNLKATKHMAQYIFSGSTSTAYLVNVYFHK